jgi:aminocarboxymuconate-semialdehyde decarboxylase
MSNPSSTSTRLLTDAWFDLLQSTADRATVKSVGGLRAIHLAAHLHDTGATDVRHDLRLKTMNDVGVDIGIVSLTCPNCYWGGRGSVSRRRKS